MYEYEIEPTQRMATGGFYVRSDDCSAGLLCVTCREPFGRRRSPRILPCSHIFCLPCLLALEASAVAIQMAAFSPSADCQQADTWPVAGGVGARQEFVFLCPTCRTRVPVPEGGVRYFPDNMYLNCGIPGDDVLVQTENQPALHQAVMSSLQHCGATKTTPVGVLENKLGFLENHVTHIKDEMAKIKTDLNLTESGVAKTKTDLKHTEAAVTLYKTDVTQITTSLSKAEVHVAQNKTDAAQSKTDAAQIRTDLKQAESAVATTEADLKKTETDMTEYMTDVMQIKTALGKIEADMAQNKTDVAQLKLDFTKAKIDVNTQMKEHADKIARAGTTVAFSAYSVDKTKSKLNHPLIFLNVPVNQGDCYDEGTGLFTAPVRGTYIFSASVTKKDDGESEFVEAFIIVDDEDHALLGGSCSSQGSNSVALQLDVGQSVSVQAMNESEHYDDSAYMSFTGALVQPEL